MARLVDYYEILQVSPNAEDEIIQAAFRRLALKWHPDRCPGDQAAADRMKLINKAYAVLSDPRQRGEYDRRRRLASAHPSAGQAAPRTADRRREAPSDSDVELEPASRAAANPPPQTAEPLERDRDASEAESGRSLGAYFRETSRVQNLACWFVALSLGDLLMTYVLLQEGPHFRESNAIAQFFFRRWNILGMTLFKVAVVIVVVALGEVIERHRPGWGRLVLLAGCGAAAYAIVRGMRLYLGVAF